jgi:hypothetical protein
VINLERRLVVFVVLVVVVTVFVVVGVDAAAATVEVVVLVVVLVVVRSQAIVHRAFPCRFQAWPQHTPLARNEGR